MSKAYYNEFDSGAAAWLRELIRMGAIADGDVDERSIEDVYPSDLRGYTQCHFFAGIGGWSYALRLAGWPDDRPVWTGSCPCQPFSSAGKGAAFADERHLWPAFLHLIGECRPAVVIGEQVASKDADAWIDLVQADMEGLDYAFGAVPFPSAGIGAPHIRDRLYWLADTHGNGSLDGKHGANGRSTNPVAECGSIDRMADANIAVGRTNSPGGHDVDWQNTGRAQSSSDIEGRCSIDRMGNADDAGLEGFGSGHKTEDGRFGEVRPVAPASESCRVEYATGNGREQRGTESGRGSVAAGCPPCGLADAPDGPGHGSQPRAVIGELPQGPGAMQTGYEPAGPVNGFWSNADWLLCRDGKWRPVESGTFPLVDGLPRGVVPSSRIGMAFDANKTAEARVMRLRGYGNAINPVQASMFVEVFMESIK